MDPITRAARAFLAEADAFFREGKGPLLPMIAAPAARTDLVKSLRLGELAPENRRPLFLYEAPFTTARAFGEGLAAAIFADYEAVREGAAEEGVTLPPFPAVPPAGAALSDDQAPPLARAVWAMEQAAALLGERLDGVLVAIVPDGVKDPPAYREAIAVLARTRFPPRVRLAVHHPPDGPLGGVLGNEGAHFHVDPGKLADHLKKLGGGGGSSGPPLPPPPALTEDQQQALAAKTGHPPSPPETSRALRGLLLDAATATGQGDHVAAAAGYREARSLCQRGGLKLEEAMVLLAIGGACLAARQVDLAIEAFKQAAGMAAGLGAWTVACQAWLGAAGADLTAKRYEAAAAGYRGAADAARMAKSPILGVEALRMAGTCHLLRGAEGDAMNAWLQAVGLGSEIDVEARRATTFPQTAEALATMLDRRGMSAQAAHVRALLAEATQAPDEEPISTRDAPARAAERAAPDLPFGSVAGTSSNTLSPDLPSGGPAAALAFGPAIPGAPPSIPATPPPAPEPLDLLTSATLPATPSPFAVLPFTKGTSPDPGDAAGHTTLPGTPSPLKRALPFETAPDDEKPRR